MTLLQTPAPCKDASLAKRRSEGAARRFVLANPAKPTRSRSSCFAPTLNWKASSSLHWEPSWKSSLINAKSGLRNSNTNIQHPTIDSKSLRVAHPNLTTDNVNWHNVRVLIRGALMRPLLPSISLPKTVPNWLPLIAFFLEVRSPALLYPLPAEAKVSRSLRWGPTDWQSSLGKRCNTQKSSMHSSWYTGPRGSGDLYLTCSVGIKHPSRCNKVVWLCWCYFNCKRSPHSKCVETANNHFANKFGVPTGPNSSNLQKQMTRKPHECGSWLRGPGALRRNGRNRLSHQHWSPALRAAANISRKAMSHAPKKWWTRLQG